MKFKLAMRILDLPAASAEALLRVVEQLPADHGNDVQMTAHDETDA